MKIGSSRYLSPAKVNIYFKVLKKRDDGYHDIVSLYQAVDLFDIIDIRIDKRDGLTSKNFEIRDDNLILKALFLFKKRASVKDSFSISLIKKIPPMSGLGGGSSNGATTLFALNEMMGWPLSLKELSEIASDLGSDVSFFLSSGSAICRGRGEIVFDKDIEGEEFFIAKPNFGLSTKEVYKKVRVVKRRLREFFFNDLEDAAFLVEPRMRSVRDRLLSSGFLDVVMTGSGSSFLCRGKGKKEVEGITFYKVKTIRREKRKWYVDE